MAGTKVLIVGAGGPLGLEIVRILQASGAAVTATYRTAREGIEETLSSLGARAVQLDLGDAEHTKELLGDANAAVFTPILSIAGRSAALLKDNQRAVFFSSNNVAVDPGNQIYKRLIEAENAVRQAAPQAVILRPTMIYGYPGDGNLSRLMRAMKRFPIVPMPGAGEALQQPVYFKALARTATDVLAAPAAHPRLCAVAGPQPLSQHRLFRAVAKAADAKSVILPLPVAAITPFLKHFEKMGLHLPVSAAQLARTGLHKTPQGNDVILTDTRLEDGLEALAAAIRDLDGGGAGA